MSARVCVCVCGVPGQNSTDAALVPAIISAISRPRRVFPTSSRHVWHLIALSPQSREPLLRNRWVRVVDRGLEHSWMCPWSVSLLWYPRRSLEITTDLDSVHYWEIFEGLSKYATYHYAPCLVLSTQLILCDRVHNYPIQPFIKFSLLWQRDPHLVSSWRELRSSVGLVCYRKMGEACPVVVHNVIRPIWWTHDLHQSKQNESQMSEQRRETYITM